MVMPNSLGAFLALSAVLMPTTTIEVRPVLRAFLMHPESTHSAKFSGLHCDVFDVTEDAVNTRSGACAGAAWKRQHGGLASDSKNPLAGDVNMTGGSGMLEGEEKLTATRQNLGRCYGFMSEGRRLLMWHQNDGHMDESIVVELYKRSKWKRTTMDGTRSFTIYYPVFGVDGAMLGVFLWIHSFDTHPTFMRAREVEVAAHLLAPAPFGLETSLSEHFMQVAEVS